jgi:S-adenosylmethionine/arginine decarboxylase-like enzyme
MDYWGYHLRIDAAACKNAYDKDHIRAWVGDLVRAIDMVAYGDPWIERFGPNERLLGVTVFQPIETSNICAHFCDNGGDAYVDVFSCSEFDPKVAVAHFRDWFDPARLKYDFAIRQA